MNTDYGVFAELVSIAISLAAAAGAIRLAFMKRAKWQPPEEAVPKGAARLASLIAMIVIALLYVFGMRIGELWLALITLGLLACALISLAIAIRTNITYSFYYPADDESKRLLGGSQLTDEAASIKIKHGLSEQQMLEDLQGKRDKLWTKSSQADVRVRSTLSFIALIGVGTSSLAAAAMLVLVFIGKQGAH